MCGEGKHTGRSTIFPFSNGRGTQKGDAESTGLPRLCFSGLQPRGSELGSCRRKTAAKGLTFEAGVDSLQIRVGEQWGDIQLRVR